MENKNSTYNSDEINLIEVFRTIKSSYKFIYKTTFIFFILGLIFVLGSKVEYEASSKILPDNQQNLLSNLGSLGGLGGLAGLAGINLDMGSQESISPDLYPNIVQSFPYEKKILNEKLTFEKLDTVISSYVYFSEIYTPSLFEFISEYTIYLPSKIKKIFFNQTQSILFSSDSIIKLNEDDTRLYKKFMHRIQVDVDDDTGIITVTTEMPDPVAAAELTKKSVDLLQEFIINHKIKKAGEGLKFVSKSYFDAKGQYELAQEKLAKFNDANQNVITAKAQSEHQRLQNDYDLAYGVFSGLATQLEQAKIKVKENTPVFTVIEPPRIPIKISKPRRILIPVFFIFLGTFSSLVIIMWRFLKEKIVIKINNSESGF